MRQLIYRLVAILLIHLPYISYAAFCPTNFNRIESGDTVDAVISKCGKPTQQTETIRKGTGPEEWSFFIPQTVVAPNQFNTQGSIKAQMTFDQNGRVINMTVNGIGVGATTICNGINIQLGDTMDSVKRVCGAPSFINKNANPDLITPDVKVTTLFYNSTPPAQLVFENGVLK